MPGLQQTALFLDAKFGKFVLGQREIPKPGSGQLLVRHEAIALNPVDWKVQKYGFFVEDYPAILGTDIAGVVEEIGADVSGFSKGDRVVYHGAMPLKVYSNGLSNDKAGFQQYSLAHAELTAKIPSNVSFEAASTLPVALAAATVGLYAAKPHGAELTAPFEPPTRGKYAGKPFVVLGGATSVGQYVIQLAKLSGFSPIITTASPKHEEYLKSLGATHVVDRRTSSASLSAEIANITTTPIEIVYDAVSSADTQQTGYDLLAEGGHLVIVLDAAFTPKEGKGFSRTIGISNVAHTREIEIQLYSKLTELLSEGAIQPNKVEVVPGGLNGIVSGLERLEADQVSGVKLVVRPQETI